MGRFSGTGTLVGLDLRRDRVAIPVCVAALTAMTFLTAVSLDGLYPAIEDRRALAATIADNPAVSAIRGAPHALDTLGGLVAFQIGVIYSVFVALMSVLLVGRHTRADEESGRTELVLSTATGRYAPAAAALLVVALADLLVAAGVAAAAIAYGLPVAGSLALGAWMGAVGLAFAAVAAVTAQLSESSRAATGMALAVLGGAYAVRAAGDAGDGALTWLSPLGWGSQLRPFADERWWPLLLLAAFATAMLAIAHALLARRDFGAGMVAPRPGPAAASPRLGGSLGLALRLQRGALAGWGAGVLVLGAVYGIVAEGIESFVEDSEQIAEILAQAGGATIVDSYFATIATVLAFFATGFAIQGALRPRGEEADGRAEPVLATATSRWRWAGGHMAVALGGAVALLAVAGLAAGAGAAATTADLAHVPRMMAATLVQAPAVWVMVGLAATAYGLRSRLAGIAWAALAACVFLGMFGALLDAPRWLIDASPYSHVPEVPATDLRAAPLLALTALAAALIALGLAALRRRDLDTT